MSMWIAIPLALFCITLLATMIVTGLHAMEVHGRMLDEDYAKQIQEAEGLRPTVWG